MNRSEQWTVIEWSIFVQKEHCSDANVNRSIRISIEEKKVEQISICFTWKPVMSMAAHVNAPAIVWHVTVCKNKCSLLTNVVVELWFNWKLVLVIVGIVERSVERLSDIILLSRKKQQYHWFIFKIENGERTI